MSNALEQASLIMVPSGYEDGTLGSLKPLDGTGDFTFSRGSNTSATRVNADGYIEKGYENLLLQSNNFSDATWSNLRVSSTPNQSGYDGTNDAWKIECIGAGKSRVDQSISISGVNTISFYAKAGTANYVIALVDSGADPRVWFNLSTGTIESSISNIHTSIESVGNGWYRCSMAFDIASSVIYLQVGNTNGNLNAAIGDNIYIQDAMLNQGLIAYPYIETTTAPVAGGILEDMPRLDYSNGSCPALLLEPQRTNSITSSEYFQSGWNNLGSRVSFENNTTDTLSPEGKYNATKLIKNLSGNPTLRMDAVTAGSSFVFTCWAKAGTSNLLELDISDAATTTFTLTNQWQRFEVKTSSAANNFVDISLKSTTNIGDYFYIWGAQVEQGSYPTSYIPTYGVSQTRLADVLFEGSTGFSNFFNSTEGTLFFQVDEPLFRQLTTDGRSIALRDTTNGEYFQLRGRSNSVYFLLTMCSPNVVSVGNFENNTKYAMKWNGSEIKIFTNGAERGSASQVDSFRPYTLGVASGFGMYTPTGEKFNNITFFPTALTDSECIELTTIS